MRTLAAICIRRPVFATVRAGLGHLPKAVAEASEARLVLNTTARELHRTGVWQPPRSIR